MPRSAVAIVAATAFAVVALFVGSNPRSGSKQPAVPAGPSPHPTLLTLSPNPFLLASDTTALRGLMRDPSAQAHPLSSCLPDPFGWGAVQIESAAYRNPIDQNLAANEYVLRFADPVAAHRAVEDAWRRLHGCSSHFLDLGPPGVNPNAPDLKDITAGETRAARDFYVPRIARAGNVVVVLEGTGEVDDRSWLVLDRAMTLASPQYPALSRMMSP